MAFVGCAMSRSVWLIGRGACPGVPAQIDGYAEVHVLSREVFEAAFDDPQSVVTVCPEKLRR